LLGVESDTSIEQLAQRLRRERYLRAQQLVELIEPSAEAALEPRKLQLSNNGEECEGGAECLAQRITSSARRRIEFGIVIPSAFAVNPSDERNLWPQPLTGEWTDKIKDQLDGSVCRAVCRGAMTLREGQGVFLDEPDWTKAYEKFFLQ